jgi:hypothetical protein
MVNANDFAYGISATSARYRLPLRLLWALFKGAADFNNGVTTTPPPWA